MCNSLHQIVLTLSKTVKVNLELKCQVDYISAVWPNEKQSKYDPTIE